MVALLLPRIDDAPEIVLGSVDRRECLTQLPERAVDAVVYQRQRVNLIEISKRRDAVLVGAEIIAGVMSPGDVLAECRTRARSIPENLAHLRRR